jgi:putative ABC transport system permease protein
MRSPTTIWRNLRQRERLDADLDAELRAYVDLVAEQKVKSGMSPAEAHRAALIECGGTEQVKEQVRDVRAGNLLETAIRDLRFGARLLAKAPGFTAAAVIMLALGIGANTAVFSVVNAVLLRGLPYAEPDRIVALYENRPRENMRQGTVSLPDFLDWRDQNTSFQSLAAAASYGVTWQSDAGAEHVAAGVVSPEFFDVLGVKPAIGAGFRKEMEFEGPYAVILTHGFWQRRFGADPAVLGRALTINGTPMEVVGVLPANFEFPVQDADLFLPLRWQNKEKLDRAGHEFTVAGRLKPGRSMRAAQMEMDTIASRLEEQYPAVNKGHGVSLSPMRDALLGSVEAPLVALQTAAALVLLIACGNLANLLLARMLARRHELWVRLAIGASRGRLIRQLLCESTLLAMIGGVAGIAMAYAAVPLLRSMVADNITVVGIRNVAVDGAVLAASLILSVLCGLIFGLVPAFRASRPDSGPRAERLRKVLVPAQVALSVVLLSGAGMFLRSFAALRSVDPGFRADGVITMQAALPGSRYREPGQVTRFTAEWMEEIRRLPGVQAEGLTSHLPVSGMDSRTGLTIEDVPPDPNQPRRAHVRTVSPGYFQALGLRIVEGRPFLETDRAGSRPVMIVNEAAARKYFPQGRALGHRGHLGGRTGPWSEVIGVVANVRHWGLDVEPRPEQYYCHLQEPTWMVNLTIRADGDPRRLTPSVRAQLRRLDPAIPLARVQTMEQVVSRSIASERSLLLLLGVFAGIALVLTAAGIWGTMAYLLSQRRREIGLRLALGASEEVLVRDAVVRAMKLVTAGLVVGVVISLALVRISSKTLYGVSPTDPMTYAAVAVLLAAVAWVANYYPARRITRSTPYTILRQE